MSTIISNIAKKPSQEVSKNLTKVLNKLRGKPTKTNADKKKIKNLTNRLYGLGKGKQQQASPTAQRIRKAESKQAADLTQPAAGSVGKNVEQADAGFPAFKVAAKRASDFDKALSKKETQLENYKNKRDSLTGKDKIKFIAKSKTRIDSLKASIKDMESRGGPGGKSKLGKKYGGKITYKMTGGQVVGAGYD
jgi:cell division septum initiation protein DivIVA